MFRTFVIPTTAATVFAFGVFLGAQAQPSPATPPRSVAPGQGDSQSKSTDSSRTADHTFVTEAAMGGMAEVELGKLASEKASNAKVKAFGQRMVADHGKADDELKTVAASRQITLPASIDAKHKATHDRLAGLSGAAFDRAYVTDMVADHKKDVAAFTEESTSGKDSDIKAWAAKTLPTLREHLRMVEELDKELGSARSTQ
jgi:putative membrane protein